MYERIGIIECLEWGVLAVIYLLRIVFIIHIEMSKSAPDLKIGLLKKIVSALSWISLFSFKLKPLQYLKKTRDQPLRCR